MIIEKNTTHKEDDPSEYPYYTARIQRRFISTKFHHSLLIEELNANSIHAFNKFEEKGYVERFQCHFRPADIAFDVFHALATHAIQK